MDGYDYAVLADVGDDVLLIEWDLAVGAEELVAFARRAVAEPDRVLFAPYRLYPGCSIKAPGVGPQWAAWRYRGNDQRNGGLEQVQPGDLTAHVTGLGMVYLPEKLIRRYLAERDPSWGFSDIAFCGWHYRTIARDIALDWSARPVHLHYQLPNLEEL